MDDVAAAVADPVRRVILEMLRERPLPARRIAEPFPISRPAVSRHLRVLRECGLVRAAVVGRERHYALDPAPLTALREWLAGFPAPLASAGAPAQARAGAWGRRLDALETEVHRTRREHERRREHGRDDPAVYRQENTA